MRRTWHAVAAHPTMIESATRLFAFVAHRALKSAEMPREHSTQSASATQERRYAAAGMEDVVAFCQAATPAFDRAPHASYPGVSVWLTQPPGIIVQVTSPTRIDVSMTNWLVGPVYALLERRYPEPRALTFVLDLDLMTGRSFAARTVFLAKARQSFSRFQHAFVIPPRSAPRSYTFAMQAGVALVRALGVRVDYATSLAEVITEHNLRAAR
jgi:hypothetical protein